MYTHGYLHIPIWSFGFHVDPLADFEISWCTVCWGCGLPYLRLCEWDCGALLAFARRHLSAISWSWVPQFHVLPMFLAVEKWHLPAVTSLLNIYKPCLRASQGGAFVVEVRWCNKHMKCFMQWIKWERALQSSAGVHGGTNGSLSINSIRFIHFQSFE